MTDGEKKLWAELKTWRTQRGIQWRKQAPLGPYVVDFVCHGLKMVVELDGEHHFTAHGQARDAKRDAWLVGQGYTVFRINTGELSDNFDGCVETLMMRMGLF